MEPITREFVKAILKDMLVYPLEADDIPLDWQKDGPDNYITISSNRRLGNLDNPKDLKAMDEKQLQIMAVHRAIAEKVGVSILPKGGTLQYDDAKETLGSRYAYLVFSGQYAYTDKALLKRFQKQIEKMLEAEPNQLQRFTKRTNEHYEALTKLHEEDKTLRKEHRKARLDDAEPHQVQPQQNHKKDKKLREEAASYQKWQEEVGIHEAGIRYDGDAKEVESPRIALVATYTQRI